MLYLLRIKLRYCLISKNKQDITQSDFFTMIQSSPTSHDCQSTCLKPYNSKSHLKYSKISNNNLSISILSAIISFDSH